MRMLNAVKLTGSIVLTIGITIFLIGLIDSGYSTLASIGLGTVIGSVFIFLMGLFLIVSEEMVTKTQHGKTR
jgi:uncharacterized membrane protein